MRQKVTAVIDIGKTNKKFFLFDEHLNEISHHYISFDEIPDDDGFLSEDLATLVAWMRDSISDILNDPRYELVSINFSTYGASLVHLDEKGQPVTPFYNYLKPINEDVLNRFFAKYGDSKVFSSVTSSPVMGLLNSGFQLYYLKHHKPHLFSKISHSLHFPQYLSYIFTGRLCSDYTSIGCHTALWDYRKKDYHQWIKDEDLQRLLPPIYPSRHYFEVNMRGKTVKVGIGVHDSSSAFIPYIQSSAEPFALISTGTWSICMNYFNEEELTVEELGKDCLNFLSTEGTNIKAARLFLGKEVSHQVALLSRHFGCDPSTHESFRFDPSWVPKRRKDGCLLFHYEHLHPERFGFQNNENTDFGSFDTYEAAYHHLMDELTDIQTESLKLAIGKSRIKTIFLDGGFSGNEVFMQLLANKLPQYRLMSSSFAKGTALGAAILVNHAKISSDFLSKNYELKLHKPLTASDRVSNM